MFRVTENKFNAEKDYFYLKAIYLVHETEKVPNKTNTPYQKHTYYNLYHCTVHLDIKVLHSPNNCTYLLVLESTKIYIKIHTKMLLHVSVCDHHQGARTLA